jgi:hypothetical protein
VEFSGALPHGSTRPYPTVRIALHRFAELSVFAILPMIIPLAMVGYLLGRYETNGLLFDFNVMWSAGRDVAHGHSPYPFVYPAPAAVLMAPLGALPWKVAVAIFWLLSAGALMLSLRLLQVRDWRCYGAVFASIATIWALEVGTITPLLTLAAAAAWRYRDRPRVVSIAIALAIVTKIFLWPLAVWLLVTRRFRAALETVIAAFVMTLGSWAIIGFAGLLDYPTHLGDIASIVQYDSFSILAFVKALGLSAGGARGVSLIVSLAALVLVLVSARAKDGDRRAFIAAIAASLLISPIVWAHYFVLLYVPIALASRRLNWLWLFPLGFWALPHAASGGSVRNLVVGLTITAAILLGSSDVRQRDEARPFSPATDPA